jgi:integrase
MSDESELLALMRAEMAELRADIRALRPVTVGTDMLVSEIGEWYAKRCRPAALSTLKPVLEYFGPKRVSELRPAHYIVFRDGRADGTTRLGFKRAVGTLNTELAQTLAMFRAAVRAELIARNPFEGVERLPGQHARETRIEPIAHDIAFSKAPQVLRVFQGVCIETGMRNGCEVVRMQRAHVDRENMMIHVPRENAKGKKKSRDVPMSEYCLRLLDSLDEIEGCDFYFANPRTKRPYNPKYFNTISRPFLDTLPAAPGDRRVVTHDARHGAVSRLASGNMNPLIAMKLIGHESAAMHWRYLQISEADRAHMREILAADRKPAVKAERPPVDNGQIADSVR